MTKAVNCKQVDLGSWWLFTGYDIKLDQNLKWNCSFIFFFKLTLKKQGSVALFFRHFYINCWVSLHQFLISVVIIKNMNFTLAVVGAVILAGLSTPSVWVRCWEDVRPLLPPGVVLQVWRVSRNGYVLCAVFNLGYYVSSFHTLDKSRLMKITIRLYEVI